MPEVSLSRTVTNGCATFTINNLLINVEGDRDEQNFKLYDVFVETGDGNFLSFFTSETETEEGETTYNAQFNHKYTAPGSYTPVANMKAIYSDDGDPKYPSAPTINTGNNLTANCEKLVDNKLFLPDIKTGPRVARSHMPKFGERNTYIINYAQLVQNPDFQNVVVLFYNQKGKKVGVNDYQQWNAILGLDELSHPDVTRVAPHITRLAAGSIDQLTSNFNISSLQNTDPTLVNNVNKALVEYTHFAAFLIAQEILDNHAPNIFFSITGHNQLQTALTITEEDEPETLAVTAVHFYRDFQSTSNIPFLYPAALYKTPDEPLTRFHDPNYIQVKPGTVDETDIQHVDYQYRVFCSNDGADTANHVEIKAYVDFDFFKVRNKQDVEIVAASLPVVDPVTGEKNVKVGKQHISFFWRNIALMGSNGADDVPQSQLWVRFKLKPKANPAKRKYITAFAQIVMGVGNITDTTPTPKPARIKVTSTNLRPGNPSQEPGKQPGGNPGNQPGRNPGRNPQQNKGCNLGCSVLLFGGMVGMLWFLF